MSESINIQQVKKRVGRPPLPEDERLRRAEARRAKYCEERRERTKRAREERAEMVYRVLGDENAERVKNKDENALRSKPFLKTAEVERITGFSRCFLLKLINGGQFKRPSMQDLANNFPKPVKIRGQLYWKTEEIKQHLKLNGLKNELLNKIEILKDEYESLLKDKERLEFLLNGGEFEHPLDEDLRKAIDFAMEKKNDRAF